MSDKEAPMASLAIKSGVKLSKNVSSQLMKKLKLLEKMEADAIEIDSDDAGRITEVDWGISYHT